MNNNKKKGKKILVSLFLKTENFQGLKKGKHFLTN